MKYFALILSLTSVMSDARDITEKQAVAFVLDQFHQAASNANADEYLNLLDDQAIFLGTDVTERWTKKQFTQFVQPYFDEGKGWSYVSQQRNISLLRINKVAFFDEILNHEQYGTCRGTGVLVKTKQGWKISQYNLSFPIPNDIAKNIVKAIKVYEMHQ
jgi:ketosteroid isomerase-like protein